MLTIRAEGHAGQDIPDCIYDMTILACKTNACIRTEINGISVLAFPDSDPVKLHDDYNRARALGLKYV